MATSLFESYEQELSPLLADVQRRVASQIPSLTGGASPPPRTRRDGARRSYGVPPNPRAARARSH